MSTFKRSIYPRIESRLQEPRRFIQVFAGPRQVGKTQLARQLMTTLNCPHHYATADSPTLQTLTWIEQQWNAARLVSQGQEALLVLDEVQKVQGWSEIVKRCWDEDTAAQSQLKVILLGSSPLLLQRGLTESLAGRFEIIPITHWTYSEMQAAFDFTLDQYIFFGGYPGAAAFIEDQSRWSNYILESLVETTISRDILLLTRVDKPALLRQLFQLGCHYSSQILSFQKMLGQLHDVGNVTTLAHYLELLTGAGMLAGLSKYTGSKVNQKSSSPKLQVLNTALLSSQSHHHFESARKDSAFWGRLVESAVGAYLLNSSRGSKVDVLYWRERNQEIDFVLKCGETITAIEVKSTLPKQHLSGMHSFQKQFNPKRCLLVGEGGLPLETFFKTPIEALLD